jgi:hypothetical protein
MLQGFIDAQTGPGMLLWGIVLLLIGVGIVWLLRTEKRQYDARGKGRGWVWMRLLALPMLALTAATIVLPARSISGPEALAYFYLALFTLGPLVWFGLHRLAGALQSPRFTRGESFGLALSGLAILIVPPLLLGMAQGPIYTVSHRLQESGFDRAAQAPLALTALPVQRFRLGTAGEIYTQSLQAPPGVHIERIDTRSGDRWSNTATQTHAYLCRQGEDLHLAWPVGSQLAPLRIHWHTADGTLQQAEYRVDESQLAKLPTQDFAVNWRADGIDLPVPLMRDVVQLGWENASGTLHYRSLGMLQPGENFVDDCVMRGYRRVAWQQEGPVSGVILRFHPTPPAAAWQAEFRRTGI